MSIFTNLRNDMVSRWTLVCNKEAERERRIFAGLELFCFPVSLLTLFVLLPLQITASKAGWALPLWSFSAINVLLSAAIGYITNYIAIEMLFKPYIETGKHPLSIVTLGYWRQGLIPKNKNRIGEELGHQIETKLLNPEQLANELCEMVMGFIQDPSIIGSLRYTVQNLLHTHEQKIIDFLIPQIEQSLTGVLNKILTREQINSFWEKKIEPQLEKEENRTLIAAQIVESLQRRSPELTATIKTELKQIAYNYLNKKIPLGLGADLLSTGLVEFIDWQTIETHLKEKIGEESTLQMLQEKLLHLIEKFNLWLLSPEGDEKINAFTDSVKQKIRGCLHDYLQTELPAIANQIIDSQALWAWIENDMLPSAKPGLEKLIKEQGKDKIIAKLNLSGRIKDSVAKQDVKEFHEMINSIAAQHLGAIQVLGYFLGLLIGLTQLFL